MSYIFRCTQRHLTRSRLLEYGGEYFNLKTFPEGEAKTALLKVWNKRMGKKFNEESGPVEKPKKKKKRVEEQPFPKGEAKTALQRVDKKSQKSGPSKKHKQRKSHKGANKPTSGPASGEGPRAAR
jgi:hypothetical protein